MAQKAKGRIIDFSGVDELVALPDGRYSVIVEQVEEKISENSGKPYFAWTFEVTTGEFKGRKLWNNTSLQPHALWKLKETLDALGVDTTKKVSFIEKDLCGIRCDVVIGQREYEGQMRNEVKQVLPIKGGSSVGRKGGKKKRKAGF